MRNIAVLLASLAACSSGPRLPKSPDGARAVTVGGAVKDGPFVLGRADLERLPRLKVRGTDPSSGKEALWEGASLAELVGKRVETLRGVDVVLVRTADRAAVAIPLSIVWQFRPVLADRVDGVALAAPVLAWPTIEQRGIGTDPRAGLWWAHEVVGLELVDWQRTFASALATPDGAAEGARRGAALYGERCIACHRLRGAGGERGPELTAVAARVRLAPFAALLARHPGWSGTGGDPPGEDGAAELWSFLDAVSTSARAGAPPPEPLAAERESGAGRGSR
jgi:mono/diheme cytochrome c family protein